MQITFLIPAVPPDERGVSRSSRTCGGMRWTRTALQDEGAGCGRRSRVVLAPRRWRQALEKQPSQGWGWQKSRSPGRARSKP